MKEFPLFFKFNKKPNPYVCTMITICKHQLNPHCATAEGSPFRQCFSKCCGPESGVSSRRFSPSFSEGFATSVTKSQEVALLCVRRLKPQPISRDSWDGVGSAVNNPPRFNVCMCVVCQCEVKRGCQGGEDKLFAHVQSGRMDGGHRWVSLRWTFLLTCASLCLERHGNPGWNWQASYWMREDLGLSPDMVWIGLWGDRQPRIVCVRWGFVEMRSVKWMAHVVCNRSLPFFWP